MSGWKCVSLDRVPFCDNCHSILDMPDKSNFLNCSFCRFRKASKLRKNRSVKNFDTELKRLMNNEKKEQLLMKNQLSISKSHSKMMQSEIDLRLNLRKQMMKNVGDRKMIAEECPKCNASQMAYTTHQLRSVDEGQTIFYECLECGHRSVLHS